MASNSQPRIPFVVRFYRQAESGDETRDSEGRTLDDILDFDDDALEYNHDYIQVLFPVSFPSTDGAVSQRSVKKAYTRQLPERSPVNPSAPLITKTVREAFLESAELRKRLALAFETMAHFYGFDVSNSDGSEPVITPKSSFAALARRNWLTRVDHNHLRISRIIRCLRILGLEQLAISFHEALKDKAEGVSARSLMYWDRAAERPLHLPPSEDNANAGGTAWLREVEPQT